MWQAHALLARLRPKVRARHLAGAGAIVAELSVSFEDGDTRAAFRDHTAARLALARTPPG